MPWQMLSHQSWDTAYAAWWRSIYLTSEFHLIWYGVKDPALFLFLQIPLEHSFWLGWFLQAFKHRQLLW